LAYPKEVRGSTFLGLGRFEKALHRLKEAYLNYSRISKEAYLGLRRFEKANLSLGRFKHAYLCLGKFEDAYLGLVEVSQGLLSFSKGLKRLAFLFKF
jgi:hypothetical protein